MITSEQHAYLASDDWLRTRAALLRSCAHRCATCGSTRHVEVYAFGGELPTIDTPTHELRPLCSSCRRWALRTAAMRDLVLRLLGQSL